MTRQYFSIQKPHKCPRIELTPLIDVIFILLLFFVVTTNFVKEQKGLTVTLPTAMSLESTKPSVTISIDRQQRVYWNGERISELSISNHVRRVIQDDPNQPIVLQADQRTPYLRVVSVLDAIRHSGAVNVMLEAKKSS